MRATTGWVRPLTEGSGGRELGGKGYSLGRLVAAGFPVPDGFCVTTAAYEAFVDQHDLAAAVTEHPTDRERIARLFVEQQIPAELAGEIRRAYADLGAPAVAVRSSATAEDSPVASFAGQLQTLLNVTGDDNVLAAMRHCWASLWTDRAVAYRQRNATDGLGLAVVIQRLVPADAAGILFTADPVTGATETVQINAAWGLGDAVVAGEVTPDAFRVDAATMRMVSRTIADKQVMTFRAATGTATGPVPDRMRRRPALSDGQAQRLARMGLDIAALFGRPVDVEWCRTGDELFIVQARPITTGAPASVTDPWNDSRRSHALWTNTNVGEAVPDVMTPATWSLLQIFLADAMATASVPPYVGYGRIGGRLYLNLSVLHGLGRAVGLSKRRVRSLTEEVFGRIPDGVPVPPLRAPRLGVLAATLPAGVKVAWRTRRDAPRLPAFLAAHPATCTRLQATIRGIDDPRELGRLWREEILPGLHAVGWIHSAAARSGGRSLVTTQQRLRALVGDSDANTVLTGLGGDGDGLASLDLMRGVEDLASGAIGREEFNQRYGHRGPHEFEISTPRPGEDPGWLDVQLGRRSATGPSYRALLGSQERARQEAWTRLRQARPREAARMEATIARWSRIARHRESARSEVVRYFWVLRTYVLRAGELTGLGDDAFFLDADHLVAALDGAAVDRAAITAAQGAFEAYRGLPHYPPIILGHFDPFVWAADPGRRTDLYTDGLDIAGSTTIQGFPGSAGRIEGRVRVIMNPADGAQLETGEVLVTTATNVGWTPLFPRAAAVVTDVGAPLSHAAIVARELGIPAIVGCGNATALLHTGDRVRVDGSTGVVERVPEVPE